MPRGAELLQVAGPAAGRCADAAWGAGVRCAKAEGCFRRQGALRGAAVGASVAPGHHGREARRAHRAPCTERREASAACGAAKRPEQPRASVMGMGVR